jgi:hypothetical protein
MAANLLKVEHHICELLVINFLSPSLEGNRPILAEDTAEIAVGEEDSAGSVLAHQRYLLAKMRLSRVNYNSGWSPTVTSFTI